MSEPTAVQTEEFPFNKIPHQYGKQLSGQVLPTQEDKQTMELKLSTKDLENPNQNQDTDIHGGDFNIKEDQKVQIIIRCLVISFGAIYTGYNLGSYSFVQPTMNYVLGNEDEDDKSLNDGICNGLVTVGIGIGGLSTNYILNKIIKSRRMTIVFFDILQIISCILQMFASFYTLYPGRLIGGLSAGANFLLCPIYIKEFVPMKWMGTCMSIYSTCVNVGVLFSYLVAYSLEWDVTKNVPYIWRLNLGFPVIFAILRMLAVQFFYKVDTPTYYIDIQDDANATQALLLTHENQNIDKVLQFQKQQIKHTEATKVDFKTLFTAKYRKRLLQALFVSATEALTGLMIYTAYSWKIYQTVVGQKASVTWSILQVSVQILGTLFLGGKLVEKYGRKQIMLTTLIVATIVQCGQTYVSYLIEEKHEGWGLTLLTILFLQIYYACLGLGISCVSFLMVLDAVPQAGVSMANSCMALFNSIYSFGFPILIQKIPMWKALLIIAIIDIIDVIIFKLWVKETKGLNEQQLDKLFNEKKDK